MAGQSPQLFRQIQTCILALLGLLLSLSLSHTTADAKALDADQLIHHGFRQFHGGQFVQAQQTWAQAEQQYRQQGNAIGVAGALINQSLAQQAIGQHRLACYSAAKAINLKQTICQPQGPGSIAHEPIHRPTTGLALKALADSLSGLGNWDAAEIVLKQALAQENRADLWQSLGELYQHSERNTEAISAYQNAMQLAQQQQQPSILAGAQIGLLGLAPPTAAAIQAIDVSVFPGILKAQAQLEIAHHIHDQHPQLALQQAEQAYAISSPLQHHRTSAEALLLIGQIQAQLGQSGIDPLQRSATLAQSIRAWDLSYLAYGELAKIWQQQGDLTRARNAYHSAVDGIDRVKHQLKSNPFKVQTDFYQTVKPIYQNYLELLFQDSNRTAEIIQTSAALEITELENFLGCQLDDWQPLANFQQIQSTTLIYVIRGTQYYQVILRTPGKPDYSYLIDASALEASSYNLTINAHAGALYTLPIENISNYGKILYDLLLKPAEPHLPSTGTITFVLDSALQNIPLDFLHDGHHFLIEKYSLSLALGAHMRQPQMLNRDDFRVLLAGVSDLAPSFNSRFVPLIGVESEFTTIGSMARSKVLLNREFTIDQLKTTLNRRHYPIVHIASHGEFSSDPQGTGIFAWDRKLDIATLRELIDQQGQRQQSIELLVLSACETAKGDQRSVLGLAGVAAQAGARSTVASLWLVNEESTVALMDEFYQGLKRGLSKAEALRQAKLSLLHSEDFNHPFFWGAFQLIGSWL